MPFRVSVNWKSDVFRNDGVDGKKIYKFSRCLFTLVLLVSGILDAHPQI